MHFSTIVGTALLLAGVEARLLWSSKPATFGPQSSDEYIIKTTFPVGNGRLGGKDYNV